MPRQNNDPERKTTSFPALKVTLPKARALLELMRGSKKVRVPDEAKKGLAQMFDYMVDERLARFGPAKKAKA